MNLKKLRELAGSNELSSMVPMFRHELIDLLDLVELQHECECEKCKKNDND
jgi:hypothetical protein